MIIKSVKINNFRCHSNHELICDDMTTLIMGENGSGKTSVLEAIYIALLGKSFRAVDRDILKRGEDFYRIEVDFENGEKIIVGYENEKKQFLIGDKKTARLPKKNRYPIVLFEPDDLVLLGSSPTRRRDYFDRSISMIDENFSSSLSRYAKALKQRNELLKSEFLRENDLFSWNVLLSKYGVEMRKSRAKLVEKINSELTNIYRSIAENADEIKIDYVFEDECMDESSYLASLNENFQKDKIIGHTSYGAHRDNFEFFFNGQVADGSASRGEVRSFVLALKFLEAQIITQETGRKPLVLLDDVFSELDENRQRCLVNNFKDNQVILTSVE